MDDLLGDMGRLEFVLRFTLSHPGLASTIVGTSKMEHLQIQLGLCREGSPAGGSLRVGEGCLGE